MVNLCAIMKIFSVFWEILSIFVEVLCVFGKSCVYLWRLTMCIH